MRNGRLGALLLGLGGVLGCGTNAVPAPPPAEATVSPADRATFDRVVGEVTALLGDARVPGGAIAVLVDGHPVYSTGIGVTRLDGKEPVTPRTLFHVGSVTKLFLGATLLRLAEHGDLQLEEPVVHTVPWFTRMTPYDATAVTLAQLLTHTAGIPDVTPLHCSTGDGALRAYFDAHQAQPLWSPPGLVWNYSNGGYALLAAALESATNEPFELAVTERTLRPLGMTDATFDARRALLLPHADGHVLSDGAISAEPIDAYDCSVLRAAGGLIASADDLARVVEMLLGNGGTLLRPESVARMEAQVPTRQNPGERYGFGLRTQDDDDGTPVVWHDGNYPGYDAAIMFAPTTGLGVVVLLDGDFVQAKTIARYAFDVLSGHPDRTPPTWTTPVATWSAYAGSYVDPSGSLGRVTVHATADGLSAELLDVGESLVLTQQAGDTFVVQDPVAPFTATFYADPSGEGWLVTRLGVAHRAARASDRAGGDVLTGTTAKGLAAPPLRR